MEKSIIQEFYVRIDINRHLQPFYEIDHLIQPTVDLPSIITQTANPQTGLLPQIQVVHLGNGHIKSVMDFILYAFDDLALVLQGMRFRQIKDHFQDTDDHGPSSPFKGLRKKLKHNAKLSNISFVVQRSSFVDERLINKPKNPGFRLPPE